jgi:hypothetical protein
MLTNGISTMCDDESLFKENSTKAENVFQKTITDKITRLTNAACARVLRTIGAFNAWVVTVFVSGLDRSQTNP